MVKNKIAVLLTVIAALVGILLVAQPAEAGKDWDGNTGAPACTSSVCAP